MFRLPFWFLAFALGTLTSLHSATAAEASAQDDASKSRGRLLYLQHCVICHQGSGQGAIGVFPPLAGSDWLVRNSRDPILAIVQGLTGSIQVNGVTYNNAMPPLNLEDQPVADVLNFVRSSWGNSAPLISAEEVAAVRSKSRFPTIEALRAASSYAPLPTPPAGFTIREVARLTENVTRLAVAPGQPFLHLLGERGNVWRLDPRTANLKLIVRAQDYLTGGGSAMGMTFDKESRLHISVNQRRDTQPFATNVVSLYRSTAVSNGLPAHLKVFFQTNYPWGIGPFNHGVSHLAFGPDGLLYVSSGSRTDGGETGTDAKYSPEGETPITACLWRMNVEKPYETFSVHTRGLRNPYGFCWTAKGDLVATENGPDADAPEELNVIRAGGHYGFPHQFADWTNAPYAHTPAAPLGVTFIAPVANHGPAGGGSVGKTVFTFDPHSCPGGIVELGPEFDQREGTLLVPRFGNLLSRPRDVGFDLLAVRLEKGTNGFQAQVETFLAPLARPLDVAVLNGRIYVLEFTRPLDNKSNLPMLPGRILELRPGVAAKLP